ncbi:MAG: SIMPL domain-containing protein [Firmicutes bacterium]|nr:SIMPL domain-containing protein [Bacillota bacterium]
MKTKTRAVFILLLTTLLAAGSLLGGVLLGDPAQAKAEEQQPQIVATGSSQVSVKPDQAKVSLGVLTLAPTAKEAQQENAELANKVIGALVKAGVPKEKIETREYSIWPEYHYPKPEENKPPTIVSYRVSNTLLVTLDDTGMVGTAIDAAVRAGANKVESIEFLKKDPAAAQREALQNACREARLKAEAIAQALGVRLTGVLSVQESTGSDYQPPIRQAKMIEAGGAPTPIEPGELQVRASVTITFRIK